MGAYVIYVSINHVREPYESAPIFSERNAQVIVARLNVIAERCKSGRRYEYQHEKF